MGFTGGQNESRTSKVIIFRAIALRLLFCGLLLGIALAVLSIGAGLPWIVPILMGALIVVMVTLSTFSDRRVALQRGRGDEPWSGTEGYWSSVDSDTPLPKAIQLAKEAIAESGGKGIGVFDGNTVIGWTGSIFSLGEFNRSVQRTRQYVGVTPKPRPIEVPACQVQH